MVDSSLEIECNNCGNKYWYNGSKQSPDSVECPDCYESNKLPEDG
jgi:DNA-directed RNA polymerase subunit RPC12/RpoP